jgi:ubiquinone/menaquinone biosynthesis C-methylase UbiE
MPRSLMTMMRSLKTQIEALIFDNESCLMSAVKGLKPALARLIFFIRYKSLPVKQRTELYFWYRFLSQCTKWYQGKRRVLHDVPAPADEAKVTGYSLEENAIRTWTRIGSKKYLDHLLVPTNYFKGMKILDVGCGPIPYALVFTGCKIFGLDQLVGFYKDLGYPLDSYSQRLTYIKGSVEKIPMEDGFFDAVISVNAIEHVDDFRTAAKEICRVLRPGGVLRFEAQYHKPRVNEPWQLNDDLVLKHFGRLGIRKISERDSDELYHDPSLRARYRGGKTTIWANK